MNPSPQLIVYTRSWGYHTVRGGMVPGDQRLCPLSIGVVDIWKDFSSRDGALASPGAAEP